jgi:ferredoxin
MTDKVRTLKVDFQKCLKAGECYYNHPDLFMMTESGFPALKVRQPSTPSEIREANEAVEVCPGKAITYEADD